MKKEELPKNLVKELIIGFGFLEGLLGLWAFSMGEKITI